MGTDLGQQIPSIRPSKDRRMLDNEDVLIQYFALLSGGKIDRLLELFTDDAVIYEPFSKAGELRGKEAIEDFLKIAAMIARGVKCHHVVVINRNIRDGQKKRSMSAICAFGAGDGAIKMHFNIQFGSEDPRNVEYNKIRSLSIGLPAVNDNTAAAGLDNREMQLY